MIKILFSIFIGYFCFLNQSFALLNAPNMTPFFWAANSQEANLSFEFFVELKSNFQPTSEEAIEQVQKQVAFLFGTFDRQKQRSVPKSNHKIQVLEIQKISAKKFKISYSYSGTIQTETTASNYSFDLPLNPDEIYFNSLIVKNNITFYPCGDEGHPQQNYFWYFFNPRGPGCPLVENKDYKKVTGNLILLPNTTLTYPEYHRLFNNGKLVIHMFYGMDNPQMTHIPHKSKDYNAYNFLAMKKELLSKEYKSEVLVSGLNDNPYIEEFSKETSRGIIIVRLFFGGTDIYSGYHFHKAWEESLKSASVVFYAGHSGLGSYLDIKEIETTSQVKLEMPKDQYQILFMNGCSSYPYYSEPYFQLKGGTKNLDVLTNGLATLFIAIDSSNAAVFRAIEAYAVSGRRTSYRDIITEGDSYNLMAVNGDEDNDGLDQINFN